MRRGHNAAQLPAASGAGAGRGPHPSDVSPAAVLRPDRPAPGWFLFVAPEELQKRSNQGKEERREKERRGGGRERALGSVGGAMFHSIRAAQGTSQLAWLAGGKGFVYTESQPTGAGVCACAASLPYHHGRPA